MTDRSKVMIQTDSDTLVLKVGCLAWVRQPHAQNAIIVEKLLTIAAGREYLRRHSEINDLGVGEPGMCYPYIEVGHLGI
jgi:hypothetical protein